VLGRIIEFFDIGQRDAYIRRVGEQAVS